MLIANQDRTDGRHDVALVIAGLGSGGAERVVTTLSKAWAKDGLRVAVVTMSSPEQDFFELDAKVTRLVIGGLGVSKSKLRAVAVNLKRIKKLRKALRLAGTPVVISFIGTMNVLTLLATAGMNVKVVISERNDPQKQSLGPVWDPLRKFSYRFADVVTANSEGVLHALRTFVPHRKLAYVPNPLAIEIETALRKDAAVILAIGRLSYQKGFDVLLSAFSQVAPVLPGWRLVIVGQGAMREELHDQARRLGLDDLVEFSGVTRDPSAYYKRAGVFVLPSRFEGTPNVLLEAMAWGLPVIVTSASPGPLEYVADGVTGLVVDAEDPTQLATALERLVLDPELRNQLGEAARHRVQHLQPQALARWTALLTS